MIKAPGSYDKGKFSAFLDRFDERTTQGKAKTQSESDGLSAKGRLCGT